jgi:hypothetical protein
LPPLVLLARSDLLLLPPSWSSLLGSPRPDACADVCVCVRVCLCLSVCAGAPRQIDLHPSTHTYPAHT